MHPPLHEGPRGLYLMVPRVSSIEGTVVEWCWFTSGLRTLGAPPAFRVSPWAPVRDARSEPARSTRFILEKLLLEPEVVGEQSSPNKRAILAAWTSVSCPSDPISCLNQTGTGKVTGLLTRGAPIHKSGAFVGSTGTEAALETFEGFPQHHDTRCGPLLTGFTICKSLERAASFPTTAWTYALGID